MKFNPNYFEINEIFSEFFSNIKLDLRFINEFKLSGLEKFCVNMVPFPKIHFFISSLYNINYFRREHLHIGM